MSLYIGNQNYIQFPQTQQQTQCLVRETDAMRLANAKFQAIWTVVYNDSETERISKIFAINYTTFTDAFEATMNQYKIGQTYTCYFNQKEPYDLVWTLDDRINGGRKYMIAAFVCGSLMLIAWTILIAYFAHKFCRNRMVNSQKL